MKAITTKYHGPVGARGARISATDMDGNRVSIPYPHASSKDDKHKRAAIALCTRMGWKGRLAEGGIKSGRVFVFVSDDNVFSV